MRTTDRLFDEFAAAWQFPCYFGENRDAFDECLTDMDWLQAQAGIVVVISEPDEVLAAEADTELAILVRTLVNAAEAYARPVESGEWWDRPGVPFHIVLLAAPPGVADVRARWHAAGAEVRDRLG
jgi:hypothetical protein